MTVQQPSPGSEGHPDGHNRTRRKMSVLGGMSNRVKAWVSVALAYGMVLPAVVVGELLIVLMGYDATHEQQLPLVAAIFVSGVTVAMLVTPAVLAAFFGVRGWRDGDRWSLVPAGLGAAAAVYWIVVYSAALA